MSKPMVTYDRLYVEFIYYFNEARDYFECHEVMEELWLEEGRSPLYQGLLQVAVGLYHHANGNINGSKKLFSAALEKLAAYPNDALGIDLGLLKLHSQQYLEQLIRIDESPFEPYDLTIKMIDSDLVDLLDVLKLNPPIPHDEH
ncbi:hypothetical protein D3C73_645900 [compost metagenome]